MPRIIGHRGFPRRYPENTIASFLGALLYGAHGVELDVGVSADNEAVIIHDTDLERVAGVNANVDDLLLKDLKTFHLGMGQTIPTLREALEAIPRGYEVFVEIKELRATKQALRTVVEHGRLDEVIFISFDVDVLKLLRSLNRDARLGINIDSIEKARQALILIKSLGLETVNPPIEALEIVGPEGLRSYLSKVYDAGAKTVLWTVNEPESIKDFIDEIDYVITDDPTLFHG